MYNNFRADFDSIGLITNGTLYAQPVDAYGNVIGRSFSMGLVDGLESTFEATKVDLFSALKGPRSKFHTVTTEKNGTLSITFRNFNAKNMSLYSYGELSKVASATAKSETIKVWTGAWNQLNEIAAEITSVTFGSDVLEEGKNYELSTGGNIYFYSEAEQTAKGATEVIPDSETSVDVVVVYNTKEYNNIEAFVNNTVRLRIWYNGLNTAGNSDNEIAVVYYLVELDPSTIPFISTEDYGSITVTGSLLAARAIEGAGMSQYMNIKTVK